MPTGVELFESGSLEAARPLLEKEAASERPPGRAILYLACIEAMNGRSIEPLREAVERVRGHGWDDICHQTLGWMHEQLAEVDRSIAEYRKAIELNPSCVNHRLNLARSLLGSSEFADEAADIYRAILRDDPHNWSSLWGLGFYYSERDPEEAVALYHQAIVNAPTAAGLRYELGAALVRIEQYVEAIHAFRDALELGVDPPFASLYGIGFCHYMLGDRDQAYESLSRVAADDSTYQAAQEILAELESS